jgi:cell division transport system permease protein
MGKRKRSKMDIQFITASISTTLVLILLGGVVVSVLTAKNITTYMKENFTLSLYLVDSAKDTQALALQKKINKEVYTHATHFISKAQVLKEQTAALGTNPSEFLGMNPYSSCIELRLKAHYANHESVKNIERKLLKNKLIDEVNYSERVMNMLNNNFQKISFILLGLAALLGLISFALINNTIRLAIYSQRFLIHTMKLVGASWGFIRRPFLSRNLNIGLFSATLANILLLLGMHTALNLEPDLSSILTFEILIMVVGSVYVFGVVITVLCAYFSINKYLRMKASSLYYI